MLDAAASASRIHLYEIYADEAAFKTHLETPHFKVFDSLAGPWLERKAVTFATVTQIAKS